MVRIGRCRKSPQGTTMHYTIEVVDSEVIRWQPDHGKEVSLSLALSFE